MLLTQGGIVVFGSSARLKSLVLSARRLVASACVNIPFSTSFRIRASAVCPCDVFANVPAMIIPTRSVFWIGRVIMVVGHSLHTQKMMQARDRIVSMMLQFCDNGAFRTRPGKDR